jgi:hypothetical protein
VALHGSGYRGTIENYPNYLKDTPAAYNIYRQRDNKYMGRAYRLPSSSKVWLNIKVDDSTFEKFQNKDFTSFKSLFIALKEWERAANDFESPTQLLLPGV